MGQQRYIMSAILLLLYILLFIGVFIKIPDWTSHEPAAVTAEPWVKARQMPTNEQQGKLLYLNNCMACHLGFNIDDGALLTMSGLGQRWPNRSELVAFIRNSNDEELKDNTRVNEIRQARSKLPNSYHEFQRLTDAQVQTILEYIFWEVGDEKH